VLQIALIYKLSTARQARRNTLKGPLRIRTIKHVSEKVSEYNEQLRRWGFVPKPCKRNPAVSYLFSSFRSAYRTRLDEVLTAQGETVRVLHTLTPVGVAMAGADEFDPYKD
jgi:hypothetical protein